MASGYPLVRQRQVVAGGFSSVRRVRSRPQDAEDVNHLSLPRVPSRLNEVKPSFFHPNELHTFRRGFR
jgi:hypothetical protein